MPLEFGRTKLDSLMGYTVVRYTPKDNDGFFFEASRKGVKLKGEIEVTEFTDLQPLAKALSDAWRDHKKLIPKIEKTLTGH